MSLSTGTYSYLQIKFEFTRNISAYFARIYLPMILLVILSFAPFVTRGAMHTRVLISISSILGGLILLAVTSTLDAPKTGTITTLDFFNAVCIIMMCFSFLLSVCFSGNGDEIKYNATVQRLTRGCKIVLPSVFGSFIVFYFSKCLLTR